MDRLKHFDERILQLRQQKEQAETKMARALFKKIQVIFGKDLDLELVTTILEEVWTQGSEKQKETWRQQATTFSGSSPAKTSEAALSDQSNTDAMPQSQTGV